MNRAKKWAYSIMYERKKWFNQTQDEVDADDEIIQRMDKEDQLKRIKKRGEP